MTATQRAFQRLNFFCVKRKSTWEKCLPQHQPGMGLGQYKCFFLLYVTLSIACVPKFGVCIFHSYKLAT